MKTTRYSLLLLLILATCSVTAQNTVYVYRNDGKFNAFFMEEVDSIVYSQIDIDSIMHENYVVQEIHTPDSIYRIPLNAIDSIGFIQPETIYEKDVVHLEGEFLDNIVEVNGFQLVFSPTTPANLLPQVGDKLAALEQTSVFPLGFTGQVAKISTTEKGFVYECDTLYLFDVASKYYSLIELTNAEDTLERWNIKRDDQGYTKLPLPARIPINFSLATGYSPTELEELVSFGAGFTADGNIEPIIRVKRSAGLDKIINLFDINVDYDSDIKTNLDISLLLQLNSGNPIPIFYIPVPICGIPFYIEGGIEYNISGEVGLKMNYQERGHYTGNFAFNPLELIDPIDPINPFPIKNPFRIETDTKEILYRHFSFDVITGDISAKIGGFVDFGLDLKFVKLGVEFGLGLQGEIGEINKPNVTSQFVADIMKPINNSDFYDKYIDKYKAVIKPYIGILGFLRIGKDKNNSTVEQDKKWWENICDKLNGWEGNIGGEFDFDVKFFETYMWPVFETAENTRKGHDWTIKMDLPKNCSVPTKLGFSLYDEDDQHITDIYCDDDDDDKNTKLFYTIFTTLPGAVPIPIPKKSMEFYKGTFSNLNYDKQLKVYPLFTFLGKKILGSPVVTMNMCPDDHHPHALDLDLPDGKLWACCDVGANAPGEKGNYFAWGETTTKSSYDEESYRYYDNETFEYVNIGKEIGNTRYDVAKSKWKGDWHMPTSNDINYMFKLCKKKLFVLDGVKGILFTGTNGQSIFFPFAGDMHDNQLQGEGQYGYYWSATQAPGYDSGAYNFFITDKPSATLNYGRRHLGRTVRPVCDYKKPEDKE